MLVFNFYKELSNNNYDYFRLKIFGDVGIGAIVLMFKSSILHFYIK